MSLPPAILVVFAAVALSACRTAGFYAQAVRGQWEVQHKARPIPEVLADPAVSSTTRTALGRVPGIRRFASERLGLPDNPSYTTFTDLGRPHVVWVVFATGEFSIEPKTWWYPLIGRLAYRGYFSEAPARALAARLTDAGLETHVGGVEAYSTLGVFHDPVLNTFVHRRDTQLAELIFHELVHQRVYLSGDTEFNEALATAYAEHGVRRWLAAAGRPRALSQYTAEAQAHRAFIALALETRRKLGVTYTATAGQPAAQRQAAKQAVLAAFHRAALGLRADHPELRRIDRFFAEPVTNARLATLATYYDLVPGFETLIARHPDDPAAFFRAVHDLSKLPKPRRHETLRTLAAAARSSPP